MKIFFPNYRSGAWLTKKRNVPRIIWSTIIGSFAGVGGSYLLENHFVSLAIIVLGIGGILVGVATVTWLNWSKVDWTHSAPLKKKVPRITSEWRYRPKEATRAYAAVDSAGAQTSEVLSPENFAINSDAWFNIDSREYAAHTFMNLHPTVKNATAKAPSSGHERAVSAYD
ncbi:MAG: hypothetical protein WA496_08800 [Candidatus Udaeobacter sp.]